MDKGQWTVDNEEGIVFAEFSLSVFYCPLSIEYLALL